MLLTLVSSVATGYLQLRALDEQLVIAERTLAVYGESLRLFELQFKYGQVSQMTVAQAQGQYETAAAQIPQIKQQIVETENALSLLLGRNPGPIPRGRKLDEIQLPGVPAGLPSDLLVRRPGVASMRYSGTRSRRACSHSCSSVLASLVQAGDFAAMNSVWERWAVPGQPPARATIQAKLANPAYKIEVLVVAAA